MRCVPSAAGRQFGPARPRLARDSAAACVKLLRGEGVKPRVPLKAELPWRLGFCCCPGPWVQSDFGTFPSPGLRTPNCEMVVVPPFPVQDTTRLEWELVEGSDHRPVLVHIDGTANRIKTQPDEAQQVKLVSPKRSSSSGHQQMLVADRRGVGVGGRHSLHDAYL